MAKTKSREQQRKAWREYAAKNRGKYLAWSRGWKSTERGQTWQEFNKAYEAAKLKGKKVSKPHRKANPRKRQAPAAPPLNQPRKAPVAQPIQPDEKPIVVAAVKKVRA